MAPVGSVLSMEEHPVTPGRGAAFPPTQWTVIIDAVSTDPARARAALETLCRDYRQPIVNWFRRKDFFQEPEDLTQSFLAYLIEKNLLAKVAPRTGRFRCFLAAAMQNFLRDSWDRNNAQKRGRDFEKVSLSDNDVDIHAEEQPDSQLDLDFALAIHRKVMESFAPPDELKPYIFQKDASE